MRTSKILSVLAALAVPLLPVRELVAADVSVGVQINSVDDFYEPLSTDGYWVDVGSYGRCWHPHYVASYWRPYCDGEWVWTDDGWYWQSDEPWGWATYHYGRWALDPYYGWVWVPDTVWGPSWVVFREGGGYCGWAPLPPGPRFGGGGAIVITAGDVPASWFVCVSERHFGDHHRYRDLIVNNTTIINRTKINTRIVREDHRVLTEGPRVDNLQKINHEQIKRTTVAELRQHERIPPSILRKTAPQEVPVPRQNEQKLQRQEEKQINRKPEQSPQREPQRSSTPQIIRGTPSSPSPAPEVAPNEKPQKREQPPAERREAPPERQQHVEQQPNPPVQREKVAPAPEPKRQAPEQREEGRDRGQRGEDGQDGRGR